LAGFIKGEVVVIPFPFSDLSQTKKRPALIVSTLLGNDVILCQITSVGRRKPYVISLQKTDFQSGQLHINSYIRPNRLFTAESSIILKSVGIIKQDKMNEIINNLVYIIKN